MRTSKRNPKPPDFNEIDDLKEQWLNRKVIPYLQYLLNATQARLSRHRVSYFSGMGLDTFEIDGETHWDLTDAVTNGGLGSRRLSAKHARYCNAFPELVEFSRIVFLADDHKLAIDSMNPTV